MLLSIHDQRVLDVLLSDPPGLPGGTADETARIEEEVTRILNLL